MAGRIRGLQRECFATRLGNRLRPQSAPASQEGDVRAGVPGTLAKGWRTLPPQIRVGMNRVPRLWRSGVLGFPLIPSPAGLGSRLASGPYGPASFGPEHIDLPLSVSAAPTAANSSCPAHTHTATPSACRDFIPWLAGDDLGEVRDTGKIGEHRGNQGQAVSA
jgi:hypothetical protein